MIVCGDGWLCVLTESNKLRFVRFKGLRLLTIPGMFMMSLGAISLSLFLLFFK